MQQEDEVQIHAHQPQGNGPVFEAKGSTWTALTRILDSAHPAVACAEKAVGLVIIGDSSNMLSFNAVVSGRRRLVEAEYGCSVLPVPVVEENADLEPEAGAKTERAAVELASASAGAGAAPVKSVST